MMKTTLAMVLLVVAYALLRGYPGSWEWWPRALMAVGLLGLAAVVWQRREPGEGPVLRATSRFRWRNPVMPIALLLALEAGLLAYFYWMPNQLERGAMRVEEWLRPETASERQRERKERMPETTRREGNWLWDGEPRRSLPMQADFIPGDRPEVFLMPADSGKDLAGQRLYLHAFSLDAYHLGTWTAHERRDETVLAGNDGWLTLRENQTGKAIRAQVFHGIGDNGQHSLVGLQGLFAVRVDSVERVHDGLFLLPQQAALGGNYRYETMSRPIMLDDLPTDAAMNPLDDPAKWSGQLQPAEGATGERLVELARSVAAAESEAIAKLRRIRDYLQDELDYSLIIKNAEYREPLINFLFYEKRGHCEFFATSAALMARAIGVPSRVSYGWAGGTYFLNRDTFVFRANDAHAWAEVWLPKHGWVVMEATPPDGLAPLNPRTAGANEKMPPLTSVGVPSPDRTQENGNNSWWLAWLALLIPVGAIIWQVRRPVPGQSSGTYRETTTRSEREADYWRWFVRGCRARGVDPAKGQTMQSLLTQLDEPPPDAVALRHYHYAVRYEAAPPNPARERIWQRQLKAWARQSA